MSDALDYLKEIRPEPIEAYLDFLKKSGQHLDNKTRFLISVITKVDKQTKAGFQQYLKRALAEGNSANEIIDAILVAFPTLGLSKIIWAVEQILELDLDEFKPENLINPQSWHFISDQSELETGLIEKIIDNKKIFVFSKSDVIKVYDILCPHKASPLNIKNIEEHTISCEQHGWKFDLSTGNCILKGDNGLKEYPTKLEDDKLYAYW